MKVRTDLALEERESFDGSGVEIHGVEVEESCDEERDVRLTRVKIVSERGAREMEKSRGTYLTLKLLDWRRRMKTITEKSRR